MLSKSVKRVIRHSDRKIYKKRLGLKRSYSFPHSPATILKVILRYSLNYFPIEHIARTYGTDLRVKYIQNRLHNSLEKSSPQYCFDTTLSNQCSSQDLNRAWRQCPKRALYATQRQDRKRVRGVSPYMG